MRIFALLTVLLVGSVLLCTASDAEPQTSPSHATINLLNSDLLSPSAIVRQDLVQVPVDRHSSRPHSERDGDVTCYTMHAFLVKRESSHSDVTEAAGEATCLSGPRYNVRKVAEPGKAPSN
jgi:hypothetical protein